MAALFLLLIPFANITVSASATKQAALPFDGLAYEDFAYDYYGSQLIGIPAEIYDKLKQSYIAKWLLQFIGNLPIRLLRSFTGTENKYT
jgi:hypothetical protein